MGTGRLLVVAVVFLASLAALVASTGMAVWGREDEFAVRDRLRLRAARLAEMVREQDVRLPPDEPGVVLPEPDNRRLAALVRQVLADDPDAEGGFYLTQSDQFAGVVVSASGASAPVPPAPAHEKDTKRVGKQEPGKKKGNPKNHGPRPAEKLDPVTGRRDPPPLETAAIRELARAARELSPGSPPLVEVREVGPSRVAVATVPVGTDDPAQLVAWVMIRLSGPEQQKARLARLQVATGLSLAGVLLALGLAAGLVRSLRRETRRRIEIGDELRKAEHLAVLGRLLAGVAHEVRNPLSAIRSTVQVWERLPEQARSPESLAAIIRGVDRLNELVGRLLLFARAGHEVRRSVDLNAVTAETLELVHARAENQNVTVEASYAANLPPVSGAGQAIGQVVLNLVTNALQAMPTGGRLACRTQVPSGGRVELLVADTGPGVPPDVRARLFEPFFTTRSDGTGLGLALCREVARQHGGDVTLDNDAGSGAVFRLTLPACEKEPR